MVSHHDGKDIGSQSPQTLKIFDVGLIGSWNYPKISASIISDILIVRLKQGNGMGTTLHVSEDVHQLFSDYCKNRGIRVGFATEELLKCLLSGSISGSEVMKPVKEYDIVYG